MKLENWIAEHYQTARIEGLRSVATAADVSYQSVQYWLSVGRVPLRHIPAITRLTGIPPADLNPHVAELLKGIAA